MLAGIRGGIAVGVWLVLAGVGLPRGAWAQQQWHAAWIAAPWSSVRDGAEMDGSRPMPEFRRDVDVRGEVTTAELRIAGLGQWDVMVDGVPAVAAGLHGSWTDYRKRVSFRSVDLTSKLGSGTHHLTVMLGNGMYNVQRTKGRYTKFEGSFGVPKLTAEFLLTYRDGRREEIDTDAAWSVARGPVVFSSTYGGEDYDARKRDPEAWEPAQIVPGPGGALQAAIEPDVLVQRELRVVKQSEPAVGKVVYDLGENIAGVVEVRVQGPAGAVLKVTPGELLAANGTVSQASSGREMWWSYTLRGDPQGEVWRPQFGYYGFRYLQAEWIQGGGAAKLETIRGEAIHSASASAGTFQSSDETLNRIHMLVVRAMHNNEVSLLTDCPHREKLGWLEQTHLVGPGLMFNDDVDLLYRETARNMLEAQDAQGMVPTIAPQYTKFGPKYPVYDDSPEWGSAVVLATWEAFRFYGDQQRLADNYAAMQAWVRYLQSRAENGIVSYGLGDWYDIGPKPPGFAQNTTAGVTGTLMLVECAQAMERIASLRGRAEDAAGYRALAQREAAAFETKFWDEAHGWYDTGSQTANAMPLALGIVPERQRARVLQHLIADIEAHQEHTTAGEVGFPYLLRALHEAGRDDVVLAMALRPDPPSYVSQLRAGATSLTEAWDANPANSQDHFMLGGIEEWFYRAAGGIDLDMSQSKPEQRITIHPAQLKGIEWVKVSYRSRLGMIAVESKGSGVMMDFDVTVPSRSTIKLPLFFDGQRVLLDDRGKLRPANPSTVDAHTATFIVDKGTYRFRMAPPRL